MSNKIKIFTLSTNNYNQFNQSFLTSFNNMFMPNVEKEFFIFTDYVDNPIFKEFNVKPYFIEHQNWPMITLKRYQYMDDIISDTLEEDDLCIFADIDLEVQKTIDTFSVNKYFGVSHPGNFKVNNLNSLEDNPNSTAYVDKQYIPYNYQYIQGCLWGGIYEHFIDLVGTLNGNTQKDLSNNIITKWHDESHLNKFYIDNISDFNIFSSSYAYPENWNLPIEKIIIHKDKNMEQYPRFEGIQ